MKNPRASLVDPLARAEMPRSIQPVHLRLALPIADIL